MRTRRFLWLALLCVFASASWAQDAAPKSRWAKLGSDKIHYLDHGDPKKKSAVVFIHGWTGNAHLWRDSYTAFPNYRVISVDLIGHGDSDKPRTEYTMELFAKSVEAVMNAAKIDKAVFVGHSMGMPIARQFYRMYPARTLAIVNVDGVMRGFPDRKQFDGMMASFRQDYRKTATEFIDGMLVTMKDDKLKNLIHTTHRLTPDHVAISAMAGFGDDALWKTDPIRVPVMAIFAESPWWPPDTESFIRSIAPDLEFHMWKGPTHFLMMEKPVEFNELIRAFISKKKLL